MDLDLQVIGVECGLRAIIMVAIELDNYLQWENVCRKSKMSVGGGLFIDKLDQILPSSYYGTITQ